MWKARAARSGAGVRRARPRARAPQATWSSGWARPRPQTGAPSAGAGKSCRRPTPAAAERAGDRGRPPIFSPRRQLSFNQPESAPLWPGGALRGVNLTAKLAAVAGKLAPWMSDAKKAAALGAAAGKLGASGGSSSASGPTVGAAAAPSWLSMDPCAKAGRCAAAPFSFAAVAPLQGRAGSRPPAPAHLAPLTPTAPWSTVSGVNGTGPNEYWATGEAATSVPGLRPGFTADPAESTVLLVASELAATTDGPAAAAAAMGLAPSAGPPLAPGARRRSLLAAVRATRRSLLQAFTVRATWTRTTAAAPTFRRPTTARTLAPATAGAVRYVAQNVVVDTAGAYEFRVVGAGNWNTFAVLYAYPFAPSQPLANMVVANDDYPSVGVSGFTLTLNRNIIYTLVVTGAANGNAGAYTVTASGPGGVYLGTAMAVRFQTTGTTVGAPTFRRPTATMAALDATATAVRYSAVTVAVAEAGTYEFRSQGATAAWNNFALLYKGFFDPQNPMTNLVAANDNYPTVGRAGFVVRALAANTPYVLVTTGATNADAGAYDLYVWGPGAVKAATAAPPPPPPTSAPPPPPPTAQPTPAPPPPTTAPPPPPPTTTPAPPPPTTTPPPPPPPPPPTTPPPPPPPPTTTAPPPPPPTTKPPPPPPPPPTTAPPPPPTTIPAPPPPPPAVPFVQYGIKHWGGPIMTGVPVMNYVYYGTGFAATTKNVLNDFAGAVGGSPWLNVQTSYMTRAGVALQNKLTFGSAPSIAATDRCWQGTALTDNAVAAVVSCMISDGRIPYNANSLTLVLTGSEISQGSSATGTFCGNYCGWHSYRWESLFFFFFFLSLSSSSHPPTLPLFLQLRLLGPHVQIRLRRLRQPLPLGLLGAVGRLPQQQRGSRRHGVHHCPRAHGNDVRPGTGRVVRRQRHGKRGQVRVAVWVCLRVPHAGGGLRQHQSRRPQLLAAT